MQMSSITQGLFLNVVTKRLCTSLNEKQHLNSQACDESLRTTVTVTTWTVVFEQQV